MFFPVSITCFPSSFEKDQCLLSRTEKTISNSQLAKKSPGKSKQLLQQNTIISHRSYPTVVKV